MTAIAHRQGMHVHVPLTPIVAVLATVVVAAVQAVAVIAPPRRSLHDQPV